MSTLAILWSTFGFLGLASAVAWAAAAVLLVAGFAPRLRWKRWLAAAAAAAAGVLLAAATSESIRAIDPATQRSGAPHARVHLLPASEFPLDAAQVAAARTAAAALAARDGVELSPSLRADLARWESAEHPDRGDGIEIWAPLLAPTRPIDALGDALVILTSRAN